MIRNAFRFSLVALSFVALSVVNTSCGSDTDYYDADLIHTNAIQAYKASFEATFGKVDPNQSWDFSGVETPALTRGNTAVPTIEWISHNGVKSADYDYLISDFHYEKGTYKGVQALKTLIDTTKAIAWPYKYAKLDIYPVISHGNTAVYKYLYFGVDYTYTDNRNKLQTVSKDCQVNALYDYWYSIFNKLQGPNETNNLNFNSYRTIDTRGLTTAESVTWWVGYSKQIGAKYATKINLDTCKFFTVNGHQYVAFNCDGDTKGDYTDLICRIDNIELLPPTSKRYLVEDLGSTADFDFNDIVFDVDQINGEQYCTVRALGGTLDIEIQVGDSIWRKSSSKYTVSQMYNTINPNYSEDYYLARFKVTGWNPTANNVCVNVFAKGNNGMYVIEFPAYGEVPMMVAVKRDKWWRVEYDKIPNAIDWFIAPNPTEN